MGIFDKILHKFLIGRAKNVVNLIQHDKNLARASEELKESSKNWKKALKKSAELQAKRHGDGGALLKRLRGK